MGGEGARLRALACAPAAPFGLTISRSLHLLAQALAESFRNGTYPGPPIPVKMLMLDAYWMHNVRANGNCKINDTVWPLPFPRGLRSLSDTTGWPLIIYNGPQCANTTYAADWPLTYSVHWDQGWGAGVLSAIGGGVDTSRSFYTSLFANLTAQGMATFTQVTTAAVPAARVLPSSCR